MTSSRPWRTGFGLRLVTFAALVLLLASPALASSGDRSGGFHFCHGACTSTRCMPGGGPPIPAYLRLLGWGCEDECNYVCAHRLTDDADEGKEPYHQFFGKWAFYRWIAQEPASVIFSLGNLWIHYRGLRAVQTRIRAENGLRPWLAAAACIQINTWLWSAVFHTRDLPWTERLDYFSATMTIGFGLLYAIIRVLDLQTPRTRSVLLWPVAALVTVIVVGHFVYVSSLPRFPYGYHVMFAMCLGLVNHVLWIMWSLSFKIKFPSLKIGGLTLSWPWPYPPRNPLTSRAPPQAWTPTILVGLTIAAMSLELFDFPPFFRTLDAHSLWHAATIPLGEAWYTFLIKDANDLEAVATAPLTGGFGTKEKD